MLTSEGSMGNGMEERQEQNIVVSGLILLVPRTRGLMWTE